MSTRPFTPDDLVNFRVPFDPRLSPDGTLIAFGQGGTCKADKDASFHAAIYLADVATGAVRLFAGNDQSDDKNARWSPDGQRIAFTSNRINKSEPQLYLIELHGGEAQKLTDLRGSVDNLTWRPDGRAILFTYSGTLDKDAPKDPDPMVQDADPHFTRVWQFELGTQQLHALTPADLNVYEYALSPDGRTLALVAAPEASNEAWYFAQLYAVDTVNADNDPSARQLCQMTLQIGLPTFSPDSQQIAFIASVLSDQGYVGGDIFSVSTAGHVDQQARNLTPELDHTVTWCAWQPQGILYGARKIDHTLLGWLDPQTGTVRQIMAIGESIGGGGMQRVSLAADGQTFALHMTGFNLPGDFYVGSLENAALRQVTHLFPDITQWPTPHAESIEWQSPDGTQVQGFLYYPDGYTPDKQYPLFVNVHGGPSASYTPLYGLGGWAWHHLLRARNCFVLLPNPRGSWGRGRKFQEANVGDLGGGDWQDINAGVDHLIARGLVDSDRVAIGGWSYGGYMTAWAVTQTTRFRCAVAGAAITNNESNYGVVSIRGWQTVLFGASLYDAPELHRSRSPLTFARNVKTPTLLLHGERDDDVPPTQSLEFYTALKHFGIPTELALYPREPHGFNERAHVVDMIERIMRWIDRYLLA